jgi:hypothetical protein
VAGKATGATVRILTASTTNRWERSAACFASAAFIVVCGGWIFSAAAVTAKNLGAISPVRLAQSNATASDLQSGQQQLVDVSDQEGPFSIGDQQFIVALHEKAFQQNARSHEPDAAPVTALATVEILDRSNTKVYEETFAYGLAGGHFSKRLTASASLLGGNLGTALLIRFLEHSGDAGAEETPVKESWQLFGVVNGRFAPFGAVLPLGQGAGMAVNGVVTGVMTQGGVNVVPLMSNAEGLEFRAWTGNFYVFIPVRVDWTHGQWGEGEQCYGLSNGTLVERGCSLHVQADRQPLPDRAGLVRMFAATDANTYNSQEVEVGQHSNVEFVEAMATVRWTSVDDRVECSFDDLWLHVRVGTNDGWVHGEDAFVALGLPARSSQ